MSGVFLLSGHGGKKFNLDQNRQTGFEPMVVDETMGYEEEPRDDENATKMEVKREIVKKMPNWIIIKNPEKNGKTAL